MTDYPSKYPEIPPLLLSAIVAVVDIDKFHRILEEYENSKEYMGIINESVDLE